MTYALACSCQSLNGKEFASRDTALKCLRKHHAEKPWCLVAQYRVGTVTSDNIFNQSVSLKVRLSAKVKPLFV